MARALAVAAALALAGCGGTETVTTVVTEAETVTVSVTETEAAAEAGLPPAVAETHRALLEAAESGDYEALRPLIPEEEFSYTFGGGVEGGPIEYWQQVGANSGEQPIDVLAEILQMPYTLAGGTYVWPFAYDKQADELTDYERELLGEQADLFFEDTGYLGWRAGIEPDGTWRFFIAGD